MTTVVAYAISLLINMGLITSKDVNTATTNYTVIEKDGKNVIVDSNSGAELIIF